MDTLTQSEQSMYTFRQRVAKCMSLTLPMTMQVKCNINEAVTNIVRSRDPGQNDQRLLTIPI